MAESQIRKILNKIDAAQRILITAHVSPDGDALGSTLALTLALREMGKDAVAFNLDGVTPPYTFLPGSEQLISSLEGEAPFDLGFVLDAGELKRVGVDLAPHCHELINVDHHPFSEQFGVVNYLDESACATGVMVRRLLREQGHALSLPVAICIYVAILSDTGSFRYSNANPEAFTTAAEMVGLGIDAWDIASRLYETQPVQRLKLLGEALQTLTLSRCGRFATLAVTTEMLQRCGADAGHTDGFVNYPRSIEGVEVSIFFRQTEDDTFKVGFRSKGKVDVGALARELGGGGHHNAAGATVEGHLDQVRILVSQRLGID
jgi:phosphoesterase RecJ-like protein